MTTPTVHRFQTTEMVSTLRYDEFIVVIDSLGRRWNPLKHPRDENGRFIRTFSFVTFDLPDGTTASGRVSGIDRDGNLLVKVQGVTPGGDGSVTEGSYVQVPHDQVQVRTVKATLSGPGAAAGILRDRQNQSITTSINSLRKLGMNDQADKLAEAQGLAMKAPNPRDPASHAEKQRAIDLMREVAEDVDTERGKGFSEGDDYEEVKANLTSAEKTRLQSLDAVVKNTYTARHSLGDKTIDGIETSQGTMKGNQPQVRIEAAENELVKDYANDVDVWDITSGSLVKSQLQQPQKAEVRDTVAEPQTEGLPETWRSAYQKLRSGVNRLTGSQQALQVAPGDRHHEDKNGDRVRVGHIVHVDATQRGREEFDGMVTRIYTDGAGKKHVYVRDFDPRGEKGYLNDKKKPVLYKDHSVDGKSVEIASEEQQSTLFQKLALEGQDEASKSMVKSFTDEYIAAMRLRYATPGALKVSRLAGTAPAFFDVVPIHLREKKDANGEKLRIGDMVMGPNGEDGFVSYLEPHTNTTKVYWHNGQSSRITAAKLKRHHGPNSDVYPGESESGTNNYVPTRDEAADVADEKGASSVAKVIRDGGDAEAIQAAMVTDVAFQGELDSIDELYNKRDQALAAGQDLDDADKTELDKWDRMFMASAGYFREDDDPPPTPPAAPEPEAPGEEPQNPDNPTEKITEGGVTVREEDGSVIVNDNTEDPIAADDQAAIDQAVEEAEGAATEAPTPEATPTSLADKVLTNISGLVDEAKQAQGVQNIHRNRLSERMVPLQDAIDAQDGPGLVTALQDMTRLANSPTNKPLGQTRLAAVLNGGATGGTPLADVVQQRLDAGEDIFGAPEPVTRPDRPAAPSDESPEGVDPQVDKVDNALSEALTLDDGSTLVMVNGQPVDEGYYVIDPATITEFDAEPTMRETTNFLKETEGSDYDGMSMWFDENDGKYRMARVDVLDTEQDATDAAVNSDTNQFVNIADGAVMNVAPSDDPDAPAEAIEDPRSEERSVRTAGAGTSSAKTTTKQKSLLDHVSGAGGADPEISRISEAVKNGEEINGADASRLADHIDGLGADQFAKPSDKGVASQLAHRLARAAGEEGARGYSSQNTALRRTSDVGISLSANADDPQVRELVDGARADIKNGDTAAAATKFRAAADLYDAEGHSRTEPGARAREHADRLDAMGGTTAPAPGEAPEAPGAPEVVEAPEQVPGEIPPPPTPPPAPEAPEAPAAPPTPAAPTAPAAEDDGGPEPLDVSGTPADVLEHLFDRIGQPADYGTEHQGSMLGEARSLAGEGLTDDAAQRLETAAADEPDGSNQQRLMQEAADALRAMEEGGQPPEPGPDQGPGTGPPSGPPPFPTAGTPWDDVLGSHSTRDFSKDKNGNQRVDSQGNPITENQARVKALRAAGRAQRDQAFDSGKFYAVVGSTSVEAKVVSGDREGYELDPSETNLFATLATQIQESVIPQSTKDRLDELTDPANLAGKRMFVDSKGGAIIAVDADGRIHGPFTGNNAALQGVHGDAAEDLTRKAVRGGGRYAFTGDDGDADMIARVGLKPTHKLPDGSIAYQYDPELVDGKYDPAKLTTAPNMATALTDHDNWRKQYESNPFYIALDQGEMGDAHVRVDVPDIDPKTGQQKVDKDGNPLTYSKKGPWGLHGASGLVVRGVDPKTGEDRFFMVQRSNAIGNSGKWQFGGGAINSNETGEQGAAREFFEETKPPAGWLGKLSHVGTNTTTNPTFNWDYANVAADTQTMFDPTLDYESAKGLWLTRQDIADLETNGDLLPSVAASIRDTLTLWGGTPQSVLPAPSGNAAARADAISHMPKPPKKGEEAEPELDIVIPDSTPAAAPDAEAPEAETPETPALDEVISAPHVTITAHGSIDDAGARYDNFTAGSNQGQRWDVPLPDGTTAKYFIKEFKNNPEAGRQEALASALYRALGFDAPEADFVEAEGRLYSKWTDGLSYGNWTRQQKETMRDGFAADAWLAAWDIRLSDNTALTKDGKPFRVDNGGTLEFRAQGSKKGTGGTDVFGPSVGELDTFRDGNTQASQVYGKRGAATDPWEADSAQIVIDLPDDDIRSLVSDFNLPDTLADTLIARKNDIASYYGMSPTPDQVSNPKAPNSMRGTPGVILSKAVEDADHPDGSVAGVEAASTASPAAVEAGTTLPSTHGPASDETKWDDSKDRSNLIPVAKVGEAHTLTMSDGSTKDYAVYKPKTPDQAQRLQLASALYNEAGLSTPEIDYDAAEDKIYAALTDLGPDRGAAGYPDVATGFVMDAWLGNLRMNPKHLSYAPDGTPIRSDLRGVLGSGKTPLDASGVGAALDGLRDPSINAGAASIYGTRSGGFDEFEYDGAAEILSIPDQRIRELVADAGLDSSMADTLIARRDGIGDYYSLVDPSTPVLAPVSYTPVNAAESLRDAKRALSKADKIGYIRSHMTGGSSYVDLLKSNRGLDGAFDATWRTNNPGKPDSIFRGVQQSALGTPLQPVNNSGGSIATHDVSKVTAQEVIDMVKDFDTSQEAWDDAANEFKASGSSGDSGQIALQLVTMQRGYQETNEQVSWDEFTKMVSSTHTHLFRGATAPTLESIRDGNWRGGTGARAHGSGVYASTDINQAVSYASWGSGDILDWAFDQGNASIADSGTLYALAQSLGRAIAADTSLSTDERRLLDAMTGSGGYWGNSDVGALAAFLGFDAIQGNNHFGELYDFNILNKSSVWFVKGAKPYSSSSVHRSKLDKTGKSTAGYGNGVRNQELMDMLGRVPEPEEEVPVEGIEPGAPPGGGGAPTV